MCQNGTKNIHKEVEFGYFQGNKMIQELKSKTCKID